MARGTITIRTSADIEAQLNALAVATERTRNWLVEQALKHYLARNAWQVEGIKQAQQSLAQGQALDFEEVMSSLRARIEQQASEFK